MCKALGMDYGSIFTQNWKLYIVKTSQFTSAGNCISSSLIQLDIIRGMNTGIHVGNLKCMHTLAAMQCVNSGIARICCEEGQSWKVSWGIHGKLQGRLQQLLDD